jgi:hypothetical protein
MVARLPGLRPVSAFRRARGLVSGVPFVGSSPFLSLRCSHGEIGLTRAEARRLAERLLPKGRPAPDTDAALVGLRIRHGVESSRRARITLGPADEAGLLRVLGDAERRGGLSGGLRALCATVRISGETRG